MASEPAPGATKPTTNHAINTEPTPTPAAQPPRATSSPRPASPALSRTKRRPFPAHLAAGPGAAAPTGISSRGSAPPVHSTVLLPAAPIGLATSLRGPPSAALPNAARRARELRSRNARPRGELRGGWGFRAGEQALLPAGARGGARFGGRGAGCVRPARRSEDGVLSAARWCFGGRLPSLRITRSIRTSSDVSEERVHAGLRTPGIRNKRARVLGVGRLRGSTDVPGALPPSFGACGKVLICAATGSVWAMLTALVVVLVAVHAVANRRMDARFVVGSSPSIAFVAGLANTSWGVSYLVLIFVSDWLLRGRKSYRV
ncbi:hypothetical protein BDY21DRAFT_424860 [Lineolata rhizophorae]|uniref:Uncharacterized protein n=1 Tax=Lineolata rhizophorae TaxID=578093 RepID=A0A6A6NMB5_9PEZI|nr:hypothetical protein BDY21DRAFT_424860 [Lineolata rhizophorae]